MKIWPGSVAMCCGSLLLAGCSNDGKIMLLAEAQAKQENESQAMHKQIKALEVVVLTLNQEIAAIKQAMRAEELTASEAKSATAAEPTTKALNAPSDGTRREFRDKVTGMSPEQLIQFVGKPDNETEMDEVLYWVYNEISCKEDDGDVEIVSAQIIFENGRVLRANFAEDVQHGGLSLKK